MNPVAVIIPLYKTHLSELERTSLDQCFNVLSAHPIIAVTPPNLSLAHIDYNFESVVEFDKHYFDNIAGYNSMMLSPSFYKTFINYEYILIYQPDAFVFRDELLEWCSRGYEYIGAPWLRIAEYPDVVKKVKNKFLGYFHRRWNLKQSGIALPTELQRENRVGNGGFSLRHTRKFYEICVSDHRSIANYNNQSEHQYNEDIFWGIEVNRKKTRLKIPDYQTAVHFAIENNCEYGLKLTKGKTPFGCHAWDRNLTFWKPYIYTDV